MSSETSLEQKIQKDKTIILDSVSIDGEITAHTNNGITLRILNIVASGEELEKISKLFPDTFMYTQTNFGYDITLTAKANSINTSFEIIGNVMDVLGKELPYIHNELHPLMNTITIDEIIRSKGIILPHYMIRVKDIELGNVTFYREGWVDNSIPKFESIYKLDTDTRTIKDSNGIRVFNPHIRGYTDKEISDLCDDVLKLSARAEALSLESNDTAPHLAINSLCDCYEDLERSKIIIQDIINHENDKYPNYETSLLIREDYSDIILRQITTIKLIAIQFPSFELAQSQIDYLRNELVTLITDSKIIDSERIKSKKALEEETSPGFTGSYNLSILIDGSSNNISDVIPNMLNNLQEADYEISDLKKNKSLFENTPSNNVASLVYEPDAIRDEPNYHKRLQMYSQALKLKKAKLKTPSSHKFVMNSQLNPSLIQFIRDKNSHEKFCANLNNDPLCFNYDMPIRFLEDARKYCDELCKLD